MRRVFLFVMCLGLLALLGLPPDRQLSLADEQPPAASPVIVELFTSQGCSSCPPADKLLSQIAAHSEKHQLPVYCLSFHVDYWNSLGWKDPYSSKSFTQRQRQYAQALQSRRLYTPQMIVNGETEFVGSRGKDAQQAITTALSATATNTVEFTAKLSNDQRSVDIGYSVASLQPDMMLNLAIVQKQAANEVPRGENSGRKLVHVHVVREFKTVPLENSNGKLSLKLPSGLNSNEAKVFAFLQGRRSMQISGAAFANF